MFKCLNDDIFVILFLGYFLIKKFAKKSRLWFRFRINLSCWIRIWIQEGKNDPTNIEKSKEFLCFEVLDVLFLGQKSSPVACANFM